jgi:hypothetical protein
MNLSSLQTSASGIAKSLATAAVALAATAPLMTAQATIIYAPLSVALTPGAASTLLNLDGYAINVSAATVGAKSSASLTFTNLVANFRILTNTFVSATQANTIPAGTVLSSSTSLTNPPAVQVNYTINQPATAYVGISLFHSVNNGPRQIGWISFTYDLQNNVSLTGWAYEDTGGSIAAGAVAPIPEPSAPLLMAAGLGVMGLVYRRRGRGDRQSHGQGHGPGQAA